MKGTLLFEWFLYIELIVTVNTSFHGEFVGKVVLLDEIM